MNIDKKLEEIIKIGIKEDAVGEYAEFYLKDLKHLVYEVVKESVGEKEKNEPYLQQETGETVIDSISMKQEGYNEHRNQTLKNARELLKLEEEE